MLPIVFAIFSASAWPMHIIDQSSKGADGVRLADFNRDGRADIVTGWEEGGQIRVCLQPTPELIKQPWPSFSVGNVASPEDAVMTDLNGDGTLEVISCAEGKNKNVFVHRSPAIDSDPWRVEAIPALANKSQWMFCLPFQLAGKPALVLGAKNDAAQIGLVQLNNAPDDVASWTWTPLRDAGWIMSLIAHDMDADGDADILFSDRRGAQSGLYWLEQTPDLAHWPEHPIGCIGKGVMFANIGDINADGTLDIAAAVKPRAIHLFLSDRTSHAWREEVVTYPEDFGTAKAVAIGDISCDGVPEIVITCEQSETTVGVFYAKPTVSAGWAFHDISGAPGVKYDLVEPLDLDGDGDLDLITCEEREINAVIWYENPEK